MTGRIWVISDTHFGKSKEADRKLIANLTGSLSKSDCLIHLGDICESSNIHDQFIGVLLGTKILIKGNHDTQMDGWYCEHGWSFVCKMIWMEVGKSRLLLSHQPQPVDKMRFDINVHGHWHGAMKSDFLGRKNYILLNPEFTDYQPVLLETILKYKNRG